MKKKIFIVFVIVILGYLAWKTIDIRKQESTEMSLKMISEECMKKQGKWHADFKECEIPDKGWCEDYRGKFFECESACRHNPEPLIPCTMQCIQTCKFDTESCRKKIETDEYVIDTNVCRLGIEKVDKDISLVIGDYINEIKEAGKDLKQLGSSGKGGLYVSAEKFTYSDAIKSVRLKIDDYRGGAHGNTTYMTWNYNIENNEVLSLEGVFDNQSGALKKIYALVKDKLMNQLHYPDEDMITRGTGEESYDNYVDFVLDGDSIVFSFAPYQVAAYAEGPQMVKILLEDLKDVLSSDFK